MQESNLVRAREVGFLSQAVQFMEGMMRSPAVEHERPLQRVREPLVSQLVMPAFLVGVRTMSLQEQLVEEDQLFRELRRDLEVQMQAERGVIRRRNRVRERIEYRPSLEFVINFIDNNRGGVPGRIRLLGGGPGKPDAEEWKKQRRKTIETLDELRGKLDTVCVGANCGKVVGHSAEVVGAGGAATGAIMCASGQPLGVPLVIVGKTIQTAGNLVCGASNVIESVISEKYLGDIEAVLKIDQELSRPLAEWLDFSNKLDANVEEIFGVSLTSERFNIVINVFCEFIKICSTARGFNATMELMRAGRYSVHIGTDVKVERLQKLFENLTKSPRLKNGIDKTFPNLSLIERQFQYYQTGIKLYRLMIGSSSVGPSLQGGLNLEILTAGQTTVFCVFQAISIANSIFSLINAASIIRNGVSKYSKAIKKLTYLLTKELEKMEDM